MATARRHDCRRSQTEKARKLKREGVDLHHPLEEHALLEVRQEGVTCLHRSKWERWTTLRGWGSRMSEVGLDSFEPHSALRVESAPASTGDGTYGAGNRTVSMAWMTPLRAQMSVKMTSEPPTVSVIAAAL